MYDTTLDPISPDFNPAEFGLPTQPEPRHRAEVTAVVALVPDEPAYVGRHRSDLPGRSRPRISVPAMVRIDEKDEVPLWR